MIISSFHLDSTHWNADCGLARHSCRFTEFCTTFLAINNGIVLVPQMVFADRSLILLCNPGFTGVSRIILHSWQLLGGKPQTQDQGISTSYQLPSPRGPQWALDISYFRSGAPVTSEQRDFHFSQMVYKMDFCKPEPIPPFPGECEVSCLRSRLWSQRNSSLSLTSYPSFDFRLYFSSVKQWYGAPLPSITMGTKWGTYVWHFRTVPGLVDCVYVLVTAAAAFITGLFERWYLEELC